MAGKEEQGAKKSRRRYGDGSIYERSDGRHVGSFYIDGKRKEVYGKTRAEAQRKLNAAKDQARAGTLVSSNRQTVAQYLENWLSAHGLEIKESSSVVQGYTVQSRMIPTFGRLQLQKLTTAHIQKWVSEMVEEGLAASTVHLYMRFLRTALNDAVEQKLIGFNPCKDVKLPRLEEGEIIVLDANQAQHLMQTAQDTVMETIVTLALATAMRRGELLALKWLDIDLEKGRIRVQRTLVYIPGQGYKETEPKTKDSKRTITLAGFALDALKEYRKTQFQARLQAGMWEGRDLVFCNKQGGYIPFPTLNHRFRRLIARAGFSEEVHFHCLRHTCATLLLATGTPIKVVQELLGHASIKMTMDIYGHVIPGMQDSAMDVLHVMLTQAPKKAVK